ncbi:MAG TPA: hypothetical protein VD788_10705, partial [Candidatus Polarisedimenticolaceae bacterium]|nr:hypothetical protein [Candidatus Polarisedimenticolaceae bacterium]
MRKASFRSRRPVATGLAGPGVQGRLCALLFAAFAALVPASPARAYDAMVAWEPVAGAVGYLLYVAYGDDPFGSAIDLGAADAQVAGKLRAWVEGLPLGPTARFAIAAYSYPGVVGEQSNALELTYPRVAEVVDSDGDGLKDAQEDLDLDGVVDPGETDQRNPDTDGDGLSDYEERAIWRTDPVDADSDGDGTRDGDEVALGTDPNDPTVGGGMPCNPSSGNCPGQDAEVWIAAATYPAVLLEGAMSTGLRFTHGSDADVHRDSLAPWVIFPDSSTSAFAAGSEDRAVYQIAVPVSGSWYLWGRFYYPSDGGDNGANSFFATVDGGRPQRFGNNLGYFQRWHWDGDGNVEDGARSPLLLGFLEAGVHQLTIEKREVNPIPPRLDALFLTTDPTAVPDDATARTRLDVCPGGRCWRCGDATGNRRITVDDAWLILSAAVNPGLCSLSVCDVDHDGHVSATDAAVLLQTVIAGGADDLVCDGAFTVGVSGAIAL